MNWSAPRLARLGYLVGIGWDAARIAADPIVRSSAGEVHRMTNDLGLRFRRPVEGSPLNLDGKRMAYFDASARPRRLPTEALLRKLGEAIADERLVDQLLGPVPEAKPLHDVGRPAVIRAVA